jgi:hypothetical protein
MALTYTKITWALSPMAPQIPGVIMGVNDVLGTHRGEVCDSLIVKLIWLLYLGLLRIRLAMLRVGEDPPPCLVINPLTAYQGYNHEMKGLPSPSTQLLGYILYWHSLA